MRRDALAASLSRVIAVCMGTIRRAACPSAMNSGYDGILVARIPSDL